MNKKKALLTSVLISGLVLVISMIIIPSTVNAKDSTIREKHVISVRVEEGDSLWSIAQEHYTSEYKNMNSYVKEIKRTNGLYTDTIHEGCYLIIPCYVEVNQ